VRNLPTLPTHLRCNSHFPGEPGLASFPLFMAALCNSAGHIYFHPVVSSFFSSPNLSGRRWDVYHTSTHGVALVQIYNSGLKRAACGSLKIQHAKNRQKVATWAPSHNFVGLYLCN